MREFHLPYGIHVIIDDSGNVKITSELEKRFRPEALDDFYAHSEKAQIIHKRWVLQAENYAKAFETLITGHALAGVNVEDPKYLEGLDLAILAIEEQPEYHDPEKELAQFVQEELDSRKTDS